MSVPSTILQDLRLARHTERALGTADWNRGTAGLCRHRPGDFFLGYQEDGTPLGAPDDRHILMVAGTRAGKGATILVPNLCSYGGSVVVVDPKGENAIVTARRRGSGSRYCEGMGQKVVLLDPFHAVHTPEDDFSDLRGGFNPLDLVDPARPESIGDATRIAEALVVADQSKEPYWEESARSLIKAIILHVASSKDFSPDRKNLVTVWRLVMAGDQTRAAIAAMSGGRKKKTSGLALLFKAMARNPAFNGAVAQAGIMFGDLDAKAARTMANIAQIACANLEFLESPEVQACVSQSSLSLAELKTDPKGVSLYMSLPQAYMGTHYRWMRMITTLLIAEMERHRFQPRSGRPVLMVLDEFAALKRMTVIENAAAQIAGFGVRMVFAVQTLPQLKETYRDNWETFVSNSGVKLFFGNGDHFTQDHVSKLVGETEIIRTLTTISETQGTSTSQANGVSEAITIGDSWTFGNSMQGTTSSNTMSSSRAVTSTRTRTDGTSQSRTVARAESLHKRPLLNPDEVGRLFGRRDVPLMLVLAGGHQPLALERRPYYRADWLEGRYDWHPDHARPETRAARSARLQRHAEEQRRARERQRVLDAALEEQLARERAFKMEWAAREAKQQRRRDLALVSLSALVVMGSAWSVLQLAGLALLPVVAHRDQPHAKLSITGYRRSRDVALSPRQLLRRMVVVAVLGLAAQGLLAIPGIKAGLEQQRVRLTRLLSVETVLPLQTGLARRQ